MIAGADLGSALVCGVALMLILEGLFPFFSPASWRRVFERATQLSDRQIRFFGFGSMLSGLLVLLLVC